MSVCLNKSTTSFLQNQSESIPIFFIQKYLTINLTKGVKRLHNKTNKSAKEKNIEETGDWMTSQVFA